MVSLIKSPKQQQFDAVRQVLRDTGNLRLSACMPANEEDAGYSDALKKLALALEWLSLAARSFSGELPLQSIRLELVGKNGRVEKIEDGKIKLSEAVLKKAAGAGKFNIVVELDDTQRAKYRTMEHNECVPTIRRLCRVIDILDGDRGSLPLLKTSTGNICRPRDRVPPEDLLIPKQGEALREIIFKYAKEYPQESKGWFDKDGHIDSGKLADFVSNTLDEKGITQKKFLKWLGNEKAMTTYNNLGNHSKDEADGGQVEKVSGMFDVSDESYDRLVCAADILATVPELTTGQRATGELRPAGSNGHSSPANGSHNGHSHVVAHARPRLPEITVEQFRQACSKQRAALDGRGQISLLDAMKRIAESARDGTVDRHKREQCRRFENQLDNHSANSNPHAHVKFIALASSLEFLYREMEGDTSDRVWARAAIEQFCDELNIPRERLHAKSSRGAGLGA